MATKKKQAPKKKAARKKPPARRARNASLSARQRASKRGEEVKKKAENVGALKGGQLGAAKKNLRDTLMVTRVRQGWTYEAIAAEAGCAVSTAKAAVKARRDALPLELDMDPAEVVESLMEGLQLSIGDFESVAVAASERGNLAVAVGAKKGANDARGRLQKLLQDTGRLPQELGALRHLIDLRAIAVRMLDAMDRFEQRVAAAGLDKKTRREVEAGVAEVRQTFEALIGLEEEPSGNGAPQLTAGKPTTAGK